MGLIEKFNECRGPPEHRTECNSDDDSCIYVGAEARRIASLQRGNHE